MSIRSSARVSVPGTRRRREADRVPARPVEIKWDGCSAKGSDRPHNEDYFEASVWPSGATPSPGGGILLVVADGLGGEPAGEWASKVATHSMVLSLNSRNARVRQCPVERQLRKAVAQAHSDILADVRGHEERRGMGTTLTAALVQWPVLSVVHAGDSRCYLFRKGVLTPLTRDHTLEGVLRETGVALRDPAGTSQYKHVLWNYLGGQDNVPDPFFATKRLHRGDLLLLTTDGLTNVLRDKDLAEVLSWGGEVQSVCRRLVGMARARGSGDDATALLAYFGGAPLGRHLGL